MGITSSMYIAITGLNMSQAGMEVASHNISNVNTPGYSRQRLNLETMPTWNGASYGQMGTGVNAQNISRFHDEFLTRSLVNKSSEYTQYAAMKSAIDNLELFFNESDGNGINAAMNDFFALWDSVADAPEMDAIRKELVSVAETLAHQMATRRQDMDAIRDDINSRIKSAVTDINTITKSIAALNQQIMQSEDPSRNQQANDLRDTRDQLLIQLGELIDIEYWEDPTNGAVNISYAAGPPLVTNTNWYEAGVETDQSGDVHVIANNRRTQPPWPEDVTTKIDGGAIGGWIEFRDTTMKEFYLQYESFVDNMIFQVNNQHAQGVGYDLYTDMTSTSNISNHPSYNFEFPGANNDIKLSALVPSTGSQSGMSDPENIAIRYVKSSDTNKVSSSVVWNDDVPGGGKWEITISLPTDSNGNITATAEDVIRHINDSKSDTTSGTATLPPKTTTGQYKIGDFIGAQSSANNNWNGAINFSGSSYPSGSEQFISLNRSLSNVMNQGHHLSYGSENATLTTNLKHTNNDVIFTAKEAGALGEKISIAYEAQTGNDLPASVEVYTDINGQKQIKVRLGTNEAGEINTTAADIVRLINEHPQAMDLVRAETPADQTGLGVVKEMQATSLDRSGSFEIVTYTPMSDGTVEPNIYRITVDPTDTLDDIVKQINDGVGGLRAEVLTDQHGSSTLRLIADTDQGIEFGFRNDTSGALAVLGLNNIFTGDSSSNVGVNQRVIDNPKLLAAGRITSDGVMSPGDNTNALDLADLDEKSFSFYNLSSATLGTAFNTFYADIGSTNRAITTQHDFLYGVMTELTNRQDSLAGVNLDEELSDILRYQYMYQASAKIISTIDELMNTLLSMR